MTELGGTSRSSYQSSMRHLSPYELQRALYHMEYIILFIHHRMPTLCVMQIECPDAMRYARNFPTLPPICLRSRRNVSWPKSEISCPNSTC